MRIFISGMAVVIAAAAVQLPSAADLYVPQLPGQPGDSKLQMHAGRLEIKPGATKG